MERIDWTKYLVPRVNYNGERYTADLPADSLDTTDLVSLPSLSELAAWRLPFPTATDFGHPDAKITGCFMHLMTRTPCKPEAIYCTNGSFNVRPDLQPYNVYQRSAGVTPSISLRLPRHYTLSQLATEFGLTKADNGLYQVQVGEYPQTEVAAPVTGKRCTGRWYTSFIKTDNERYVLKQNPEYEYQNGKYVLLANNKFERWYKVEPLTWWVTNSAAVEQGTATQLDLTCQQMIIGEVPFNPGVTGSNFYVELWQNSLMRAFLNSADSRTLDGNPAAKPTDSYWDFTQGGFLQQALNMTREATREYTVPASEEEIPSRVYGYCEGLRKLVIPRHVTAIGIEAFANCPNLRLQIELPRNDKLNINAAAFASANFKYLYVPRDPHGQWLWLTPDQDPTLANDYYQTGFDFNSDLKKLNNLLDDNYRQNFLQVSLWRQQGKVKFMPPEFTLATFPATEMANYFVNNNHKRWAELVKSVHFDLLADKQQKVNSLTDLMKIYYALGGFSAHQGERDKAFAYIDQQVAQYRNKDKRPSLSSYIDDVVRAVAEDIHQRFSRLVLKGPYNPTFAQFFMKYYHTNPDFMRFELFNRFEQDYLCAAHNAFDELLQKFPNRVVNGNTERDLLTPRFVAEHCSVMHYDNVDEQNVALAETVGAYGYTQDQFDKMQNIYNQAKKLKDQAVIRAADKGTVSDVSYRVLEKDDPLGFVIGDITNCCQHLGGAGESCVTDGYTNPNAGFLVFETTMRDADGKATGEKRILGQAYIWYDPATLTVCYDNIEIPSKVLAELESGEKHHQALSVGTLIQTIINSADGIMTAMNHKGTRTPVSRVTVGQGYNDLRVAFDQQFTVTSIRAEHRDYSGYTDAKAQYLIRTYEQTQAKLTTATVDGNHRGLKIKPNTEREV